MLLLQEKHPLFFVVEGMDYSGKSTIVEKLKNYLIENQELTVVYGNPGGDEIGKAIRAILKSSHKRERDVDLALLYANRLHNVELAKQAMQQDKKHVIMDRWDMSSHVYQRGEREGIMKDRLYYGILPLHEGIFNLPIPDVLIWLDVDKETVASRAEKRGTDCENDIYEWDRNDPTAFDKWYDEMQERYSSIAASYANTPRYEEIQKKIKESTEPYHLFSCSIHPVMNRIPARYLLVVKVDKNSTPDSVLSTITDALFTQADIHPEFNADEEVAFSNERYQTYVSTALKFLGKQHREERNETKTHDKETTPGGEIA